MRTIVECRIVEPIHRLLPPRRDRFSVQTQKLVIPHLAQGLNQIERLGIQKMSMTTNRRMRCY